MQQADLAGSRATPGARIIITSYAETWKSLAAKLGSDHEYKICVDTAPLLERSYAREAGLGWIGKNTCLINQEIGSWVFLGEILTSLEIESDFPAPDRCGTCTRCIDLVPRRPSRLKATKSTPAAASRHFTIELHGAAPQDLRPSIGQHLFGCDICQDVCPWNGRAPVAQERAFEPRHFAPSLEFLAGLTEDEFRHVSLEPHPAHQICGVPKKCRDRDGQQQTGEIREPLEKLAAFPNALVAEHARWALEQMSFAAASHLAIECDSGPVVS